MVSVHKVLPPIIVKYYLLYKCPEEHRFQAAGNERKKERILIERMKEKKARKQEKEKERKKDRKKEERKKEKSRQTAA
jgi:hypothetical protein